MPTCYSTPKTHPAFPHFFIDLKDPRLTVKGNHLYPLEEILFLSISAVISGADSWTSISLFGRSKLDWLIKWYPYPHRTPFLMCWAEFSPHLIQKSSTGVLSLG
jgi:hypothetical protein